MPNHCTNSTPCIVEPLNACSAMRQAILVVGMHRSGTSALTRVVNLLGAAPPATIMEAGPDNERGYWESSSLVEFHDRLLGALDSHWGDWRAIDPGWQTSDASQAYRNELIGLIESEFGENSIFVSKDPRVCRLLPLWLKTLASMQIEPIALVSVRAPSEVAESLKKRNNFSLERSIALWLRHMLDAEQATRGMRRAFVHYDGLLSDWTAEIKRASSVTGFEWPRSPEETAPDINAFLSSKLRHHCASKAHSAAIERIAPWASKTYEVLMMLRDDPCSDTATQLLDNISAEFQRASSLFGHMAYDEQKARCAAETHAAALEKALCRARKHPFKNFRRFVRWRTSQMLLHFCPVLPQAVIGRVEGWRRRNAPMLVSDALTVPAPKGIAAAFVSGKNRKPGRSLWAAVPLFVRLWRLSLPRWGHGLRKLLGARRFDGGLTKDAPLLVEPSPQSEKCALAVICEVASAPSCPVGASPEADHAAAWTDPGRHHPSVA